MIKILYIFFLSITIGLLNCIPLLAEEKDPLNTLDALNHAVVSIYRVEKNPSKEVVQEELDNIINNLAVGNITDDRALVELFTDTMLNTYLKNKLRAKDIELLRRRYEAQVNRAFLEVKPETHIMTEVAVAGAKEAASNFSGGNLVGSLIGAGIAAGSAIGDYFVALQANERIRQQAQGAENEYMTERMAGEWQLDKENQENFLNLKGKALAASWELLNKYGLPDEARITDANLDNYFNFISEKNPQKAIRMGKRIEQNFSQFAPYWFYLGLFYLEDGNKIEARKCFEKFEEVFRPIQRKNTFAAANARYKIFTLEQHEIDEAKRLLNIIEKQSLNNDWNNILFAALQNYNIGEMNKAEELLQQNIDNGYNIELNKKILQQIRENNINFNDIKDVVIKYFDVPEISKQTIQDSRVYFAKTKSDFPPNFNVVLDRIIEILNEYPYLKIRLEGNTDTTITQEEALILGENRVKTVYNYLVSHGINPNQVELISWGRENPAVLGEGEEILAMNRRVDFRVISQ